MKFLARITFLIAVTAFVFACESKPEGQKVTSEEATKEAAAVEAKDVVFTIDPATSVINWVGRKKFVGDNHNGTIKLTTGKLAVKGNNISAGDFTIDMNSIVNEDVKKEAMNAKLVGHLKSPDFFDVGNHPTAKFEIVKVEPVKNSTEVTHNITGNLTMRDQTKEITFPANVAMAGGKITAVAPNFTINRTEWGVNFRNEGLVGEAKDNIISNDITLNITLNGTKS